MKIWIDADACPKIVKEVVFKSSSRLNLPVCLVANKYLNVPLSPLITFVKVELGADVADNYIVAHCENTDLVITADIPLASQIVAKDAIAINPRGEVYTEDNICEALSMRNFMQDLRDSGMSTSGPPPLGPKDKENFTNSLNRILTQMLNRK